MGERGVFIPVCGDDSISHSIFTLNWHEVNILSRSSVITMNMDEEVSLIAKDTTAALRAGHKKTKSQCFSAAFLNVQYMAHNNTVLFELSEDMLQLCRVKALIRTRRWGGKKDCCNESISHKCTEW